MARPVPNSPELYPEDIICLDEEIPSPDVEEMEAYMDIYNSGSNSNDLAADVTTNPFISKNQKMTAPVDMMEVHTPIASAHMETADPFLQKPLDSNTMFNETSVIIPPPPSIALDNGAANSTFSKTLMSPDPHSPASKSPTVTPLADIQALVSQGVAEGFVWTAELKATGTLVIMNVNVLSYVMLSSRGFYVQSDR